jgi:Siphovirus ReqiPepy6 Gp37-like protein
MTVWTLYVTDRTGVRQAQIDVYERAEIIGRISDVSTWSLTLPTDTIAGRIFAASYTTARLEVRADDIVWRSGPITSFERSVDVDGDMLSIAGVDDTVWLQRRNAHPQPGTWNPPYALTAYDVHTGAVSTVLAELANVNVGPGAANLKGAERRVPGLTVPTPVAAGPNVTVNARWQNLLTLMQDTARGTGIVFDIVNLSFRAYQSQNKGAVFSAGLETLGAWKATAPAPAANMIVVAGQGEGTARKIVEGFATNLGSPSIAQWGRIETFRDRRDSNDDTQLYQAGQEALALSVTPTTVVFTPLDTPAQTFGRDWNLGDTVTVLAGDTPFVDTIREIHVTLEDDIPTVVPSVGAPAQDLGLFRSLAGLDRRARQLERV